MTDGATPAPTADTLWLADWRRRVGELYAEVRSRSRTDPAAAWELWRAERERLYRTHPQSPVPAAERASFRARHFAYDAGFRFEAVAVEADPGRLPSPTATLPASDGGDLSFARVGRIALALTTGVRLLAVYWVTGYAGGLFLPFRDATNGHATYGAGRYALDAAKGADLGGDADAGTLVIDLNFAFHPSCAFDPRWACPLAPPENRLDVPIRAGERLR